MRARLDRAVSLYMYRGIHNNMAYTYLPRQRCSLCCAYAQNTLELA